MCVIMVILEMIQCHTHLTIKKNDLEHINGSVFTIKSMVLRIGLELVLGVPFYKVN